MATILRVGIQPAGSSTEIDMEIIAGLLGKQTDIVWRPVPEASVSRKLEWLQHGSLELMSEASSTPMHFEGRLAEDRAGRRGPFDISIVAAAHSGAFGYMVRSDSRIRTIYDIGPETRVAFSGSSRDREVCALLTWLKLNNGPIPDDPTKADWKVQIVRFDGWEASLKAVPEGRADVAGVTPHNPLIKDAASKAPGIRFLELPVKEDPEGARRFRQAFPFSWLAPAPEHGVKEIWGVTTTISYGCLWCRADFDETLAYQLTKWFDTSYPSLKDRGNKLTTYRLDVLRQMLDSAMAPVHPGTLRFLRERGLWKAADDARQEYNSRLLNWYRDAWNAARQQATAAGIEPEADSEPWARLWSGYRTKISLPRLTAMTDEEIREGLRLLSKLGR